MKLCKKMNSNQELLTILLELLQFPQSPDFVLILAEPEYKELSVDHKAQLFIFSLQRKNIGKYSFYVR